MYSNNVFPKGVDGCVHYLMLPAIFNVNTYTKGDIKINLPPYGFFLIVNIK